MDPRANTVLLLGASTLMSLSLMAGCARTSSVTPSPSVAVTPSAGPVSAQSASTGGAAIHVELVNATADRVSVDVVDASRSLVRASSGSPGDGASVEPYKLVVINETPTTLRLTWVGGPCDSANALSIDETGRQFLLVQPECNGDSIVHDRILVLEFTTPITATDVHAVLQDGLDTSG